MRFGEQAVSNISLSENWPEPERSVGVLVIRVHAVNCLVNLGLWVTGVRPQTEDRSRSITELD